MSQKKIKLTSIKLALLGEQGVGKTAIYKSITGKKFDNNEISTIGYDKEEVQFKLKNGSQIKVIIFDTAGQERFRSATLQIRHVHGIMLVFNIIKSSSFDNIGQWLTQINDNFD